MDDIIWGCDANACPPSLNNRTREVQAYGWGLCPICRMTAHVEGLRDIIEGSAWCAGFCERVGPWACQEEATMEMVMAWRRWAAYELRMALAERDHKTRAVPEPDAYLGMTPELMLGRGLSIRARVIA